MQTNPGKAIVNKAKTFYLGFEPLRNVVVRRRHSGLTSQDVLLASYPRSGSTWFTFLLYESLTQKSATFESTYNGVPGVGRQKVGPHLLEDGGRVVRSHERFHGPVKRAIYVVRDPRGVALSLYRFRLRREEFSGTFDEFFEEFIKGRIQPFGPWESHVGYWLEDVAGEMDIHLVRFEDLRKDPQPVLRAVLEWLGKPADADLIAQAIHNNDVEHMKNKEDREAEGKHFGGAQNKKIRFVNQGSTSGWDDRLSPDQLARIDERMGPMLDKLVYPRTEAAASTRSEP